jgi:microcystin-dependent protein
MNFQINNNDVDLSVEKTIYLLRQSIASTGDYKFSASNVDINDWLLCDGRSLLIKDYPELYNIIMTNFGSVDLEHFNIPDFRGKIFGPLSLLHPLGQNIGAEQETLSISQIPSHNHTATTDNNGSHNHNGITSTNGEHTHTSNAIGGPNQPGLTIADGSNTVVDTDSSLNELNVWRNAIPLTINNSGNHNHGIDTDGIHNHNITVNNTGGGLPHNNMQPTLFAGNIFILSKTNYYL